MLIDPAVSAVAGDDLLSHHVGKLEWILGVAERHMDIQKRREHVATLRTKGDFAAARRCLGATTLCPTRMMAELA